MSEPRFTIQESSGMYLHLPIFDNGVEMADGDVCILLNEQQDTINEYKKDNAKWRRKCLDLLVIIRTELLPRISDDEVKRLQKLIDDD